MNALAPQTKTTSTTRPTKALPKTTLPTTTLPKTTLPKTTLPKTPPMDTATRVRSSLASTGTALVRDSELRAAVDVLFEIAAPTLAPRHQGMRLDVVSAHGVDLELFYAPHRNAHAGAASTAAVRGHDVGHGVSCAGCPFCAPSGPSLSWRGRRVLPNAYPYAPATSQHLLLVPLDHRPQEYDAAFFGDALALQRWLGVDVALHFNGKAGHSQPHLHVHAHRERLPLERAIDDGSADRRVLGVVAGARVERVGHGPLRALLVSGADYAVTAAAARLVAALDDDAAVAGRYNIHLLRRSQDARLVIVPRRAAVLSVDDADGVKVGAGAFDVAGSRVVEGAVFTQASLAAWQALLPQTVVDPDDIAGVARVVADARDVVRGPVQLRLTARTG